jgi:hypothetical protein
MRRFGRRPFRDTGERALGDEEFSKSLWAALANVEWQRGETEGFGVTFRLADDLVRELYAGGDGSRAPTFYMESRFG